MDSRPGGEYLPFDWVDEGKLLLFMKTQVAERAPPKAAALLQRGSGSLRMRQKAQRGRERRGNERQGQGQWQSRQSTR
jgi:hypothetical protein